MFGKRLTAIQTSTRGGAECLKLTCTHLEPRQERASHQTNKQTVLTTLMKVLESFELKLRAYTPNMSNSPHNLVSLRFLQGLAPEAQNVLHPASAIARPSHQSHCSTLTASSICSLAYRCLPFSDR
jgi:hypothetical protein